MLNYNLNQLYLYVDQIYWVSKMTVRTGDWSIASSFYTFYCIMVQYIIRLYAQ